MLRSVICIILLVLSIHDEFLGFEVAKFYRLFFWDFILQSQIAEVADDDEDALRAVEDFMKKKSSTALGSLSSRLS